MFKSAATKLAHNSTIPALAGNSDLRPLQEVITAEKLVLQSLQKLSTDFGKSSEALRTWASGEGEDLGDTFSACSTLLNHWVSSLASFASHITHIRECLKAVRSREEALDDMNRRRKSLMSKAESADKKLNKMSPENKNLRQQTDLLMGLREQIRTLDVEIMNEEASLGDWKRFKAREWMGVLFGALLECSEKGAVVATFGRTIIGYVSTDKTEPGLPRAHYSGHSQVEPLVVEAERELHKISFISEVGDGSQQPPYHIGDIPGLPPSSPTSPVWPTPTQPYASSTLPNNPPSNPYESNEFGEYSPHSQPQTYTPGQRTHLSSFDQLPRVSPTISTPFLQHPSPQGGSGFTPGHKPHLSQSSIHSGSGFTPSYPPPASAAALHPTPSFHSVSVPGSFPEPRISTGDTFSSSIAKALGESWSADGNRSTEPPRLSTDGPPPSYAMNNFSTSNASNPQGPSRIERKPVPVHIEEVTNEDDDGVGLSYLNPDGPRHSSEEKRLSDGGFREDRKVRWGSVRDVDTELEKRYSEEIRNSHEMRRSLSPGQNPQNPSPAYRSRTPSPPMPEPHLHVHQPAEVLPTESPTSTDEPLPNPNASVEDEGPSQLDERSLNALAAREISKQMEMSGSPLSPPSLPFAGRKSVSPRPSFTSEIPPSTNSSRFDQILPPLPPPQPQFTDLPQNRNVTPTPTSPQPPPPFPTGALSHSTSMDSALADSTQLDDPYHTPPEYIRNPSTPPSPSMTQAPPLIIPQISPNLSSSPSTPTTMKKISAAAFRRPGMKAGAGLTGDSPRQDSLSMGFRRSPGRSPSREIGDDKNVAGIPDNIIGPLNLRKKVLPAVPEPPTNPLSGPRDQGAPRSVSSPFPSLRTSEEQPSGPGREPLLSSPEPQRQESTGGDEEFDVSMYMNEDEKTQSAAYRGGTNGYDHDEPHGYGSGRFAAR